MGTRRAAGHGRQNDENGVSIPYWEVKRLWEPDLIGHPTDSISSRALGCHLWPTFPAGPAFTRKVVHALIFHRLFKPAAHCGEHR